MITPLVTAEPAKCEAECFPKRTDSSGIAAPGGRAFPPQSIQVLLIVHESLARARDTELGTPERSFCLGNGDDPRTFSLSLSTTKTITFLFSRR
jgi:hypothetical protein